MYERYFQHFNEKVPLTEDEQEFIKNYFTVKKLRKRQYLLQEGDVCKYVAFVEKGALRLYRVNEDGSEHIVAFALEGFFITDLYSFLTNETSTIILMQLKIQNSCLLQGRQVMNCESFLQNTRSSFSGNNRSLHARETNNIHHEFKFGRTL